MIIPLERFLPIVDKAGMPTLRLSSFLEELVRVEDSREIGFRLGQISEFSLLIAVLAVEMGVIGMKAGYLIQVCALITFIVSSYLVVHKFPTPMATSDELRRD